MPPTRFRIQHLAFDEESVQIGYYDPYVDMKAPGLVRLHTLVVTKGGDYDEEIQDVMDAIQYLLNDVGEDWENLPSPQQAQEQAAVEPDEED